MNSDSKKRFFFGVFYLIGFNALIAQIVYIREFLVIFSGNEISLGIILGNWLLWTALGSIITGRTKSAASRLSGRVLLLVLLIPATMLTIRLGKLVIQTTPGEIPGIGAIFAATFLILAPVCYTLGSLFVSCSRFFSERFELTITQALARVYLWESLGAAIGGILLSLLLLNIFGALYITIGLSLINLIVFCFLPHNRSGMRNCLIAMVVFIIFVAILVTLSHLINRHLWQGMTFIAEKDSRYGKLSLVGLAGEIILYENGTILLSSGQEEVGEENVHYALLLHPEPVKVLLIGGGLSGGLMEAVKHRSIESIDYVELDPEVIAMYRHTFPQQWQQIVSDPRIKIHMYDGRAFLKRCRESYDVIIVQMPDPCTMQLNRFYTTEFYHEVAQHLTADGIYSFRATGAENYISAPLAHYVNCLYHTLKSQFKHVGIMPGSSIHYFASKENQEIVPSADTLIARINRRQIQTNYVQEYFIRYRLMPDRVAALWQEIKQGGQGEINSDYKPAAYYYTLILWGMQFFPDLNTFAPIFTRNSYWYILCLFLLFGMVAIVIMACMCSTEKQIKGITCFAVLAVGFSVMTCEIVLLLVFQSLYGYLYHQVALLMAAVMAGLALGSWFSLKYGMKRSYDNLIGIHTILMILPILFYYLMIYGQTSLFHSVIFLIIMSVIGIIGGAHFPQINHLFCRTGGNPGMIYGFDLLGALLGASLVGTLSLPLFGLLKTALLIVVFNFLVLLALFALQFKVKMVH